MTAQPAIVAPAPLRYFDREFQVPAVKILPGQYHAARGQGAITTVLGSCVSTCLWDPVERIGGMNHFMLPGDAASADDGDARLANIACWAVRHPAAPFAGMTQTGSLGLISAASPRHPRP